MDPKISCDRPQKAYFSYAQILLDIFGYSVAEKRFTKTDVSRLNSSLYRTLTWKPLLCPHEDDFHPRTISHGMASRKKFCLRNNRTIKRKKKCLKEIGHEPCNRAPPSSSSQLALRIPLFSRAESDFAQDTAACSAKQSYALVLGKLWIQLQTSILKLCWRFVTLAAKTALLSKIFNAVRSQKFIKIESVCRKAGIANSTPINDLYFGSCNWLTSRKVIRCTCDTEFKRARLGSMAPARLRRRMFAVASRTVSPLGK